MLRRVLFKKYVDEVLNLLDRKGELFFGQILKETGINPSNLTSLLKELQSEELIENVEKRDYEGGRVKSYYSLTPKGKKALLILKIIDKLDNLEDNQNITIHYNVVNGDNNKIISNSTINNSSINIK